MANLSRQRPSMVISRKRGARLRDMNKIPEIRKAMEGFRGHYLEVGVLEKKGGKPYNKTTKPSSDSQPVIERNKDFVEAQGQREPATIGQVAFFNEYGTRNEDGSVHIPARSFIRSTMDENRDGYMRDLRRVYNLVSIGKLDGKKALALVGQQMADDVAKKIKTLRKPPNAPSTVEAKGSSNPLVDTGQLMQSIAFNVTKLPVKGQGAPGPG